MPPLQVAARCDRTTSHPLAPPCTGGAMIIFHKPCRTTRCTKLSLSVMGHARWAAMCSYTIMLLICCHSSRPPTCSYAKITNRQSAGMEPCPFLFPFSFPLARGRGAVWASIRSGSGRGPAGKRFLVHSELKITFPVMAHFLCIVTRIGPATNGYGVSQKWSGRMLLSRKKEVSGHAKRLVCY